MDYVLYFGHITQVERYPCRAASCLQSPVWSQFGRRGVVWWLSVCVRGSVVHGSAVVDVVRVSAFFELVVEYYGAPVTVNRERVGW